MRDVLCIYYSRTGNTKRVMETIAKEMDAELLALTDGVERSGLQCNSSTVVRYRNYLTRVRER